MTVHMGGLAFALVITLQTPVTDEAGTTGDRTFELEEVSVFDLGRRGSDLIRGRRATVGETAEKEVKGIPELHSANPLFGAFSLGPHDDEGEQRSYAFVLDESAGTGAGYDRLLIDANGDGDLSDARDLSVLADPPAGALSRGEDDTSCFEITTLALDLGEDVGIGSLEVLPKMRVWDEDTTTLALVATQARRGRIVVGGTEKDLVLGQGFYLTGRYDAPSTFIDLDGNEWWWGADRLDSARRVGDRFYTFSVSPDGRRFTVHLYSGEVGVFRIGAGGRDLEELTCAGSLTGDFAVAVGKYDGRPEQEGTVETVLPVGDYRPSMLDVNFGSLDVCISFNYHSDGQPSERGDRPAVYGIQIRKDRPFVFDLSQEPAVMFASPAAGQRFERGETVEVLGVLIDPELDIMIRGLEDSRERIEKSFESNDGETHTYEEDRSLDPQVRIVNSRGRQVSTGVMPFG